MLDKLNTPRAMLVVLMVILIWITIVDSLVYLSQESVAPKSDQTAVFLGDSYTEGTGASSPSNGYVRYAGEVAGLNAKPAAQGGTGIVADNGGAIGAQKFDDRLATTVFPYDPDVVVIAGGLNDERLIDDGKLTLAQYRAEYDKLIADIRGGLPKAKIVVLGPFCPESPTSRPTRTILDIRDANKAAAQKARVPFIDVFYLNDENKAIYISADGNHPNDAGHEYLGEKLGADLARVLR